MTSDTSTYSRPYTLTSEYDRAACAGCVCSTCYEQEFCNRCSDCRERSNLKDRCNAYEGACNY